MSKELTEKWAKETNPMAYSDFLFRQNEDLRKENKSLQEQLKEANKIIRMNNSKKRIAESVLYIKKWGVK